MHSDLDQSVGQNGAHAQRFIIIFGILCICPLVYLGLQYTGYFSTIHSESTPRGEYLTLVLDILFDSSAIALSGACALSIFGQPNRNRLLLQFIAFACVGWCLLDFLQIWLSTQLAVKNNVIQPSDTQNYLFTTWQYSRFFSSILLLALVTTFFWLKGHKTKFQTISQPSFLLWGLLLAAFFAVAAHSLLVTQGEPEHYTNVSMLNTEHLSKSKFITLLPLFTYALLTILLLKSTSNNLKLARAHRSQSYEAATSEYTEYLGPATITSTVGFYVTLACAANFLAEIIPQTSIGNTNSQLLTAHYLKSLGLVVLLIGLLRTQSTLTDTQTDDKTGNRPLHPTQPSQTEVPKFQTDTEYTHQQASHRAKAENNTHKEKRSKHWRWPLRLKLPMAGLCLGIIVSLSSSIIFYNGTKTLINRQALEAKAQKTSFVKSNIHNYFNRHTQLLLQLSQSPSVVQLSRQSESADTRLVNFIAELIAREPGIQAISIFSTEVQPALRLQIKRLASGRIVQTNLLPPPSNNKRLSLETPLLVQTLKSSTDTVWHQSKSTGMSTLTQHHVVHEHLSTPIIDAQTRIGVIHIAFNASPLFEKVLPQHAPDAVVTRDQWRNDQTAGDKQDVQLHIQGLLTQTGLNQASPITLAPINAKIGKVLLRPWHNTPYLQNTQLNQKANKFANKVILAIDPKTLRPTHAFTIDFKKSQSSSPLYHHFVSSLLIGLSLSILAFMLTAIITHHLLSPLFELIKSLRSDNTLKPIPDLHSDADEGYLLTLAVAALHERKALADTENQNLALNLEKTYQQLDVAEHFKNHFLASMSHEVRTPLNGVLGMLDLVRRNKLSEEQCYQIDLAYTSAQALLRIINDIIDFSDIETNKLTLSHIDFDLKDLLEQIQSEFKPLASQKQICFSIDFDSACGNTVSGDPTRVGQILSQLISNAIKFTAQGQVVVAIKLREEGDVGRRLFCSVLDTGMGITPNQTNTLFEAFTQLDNSMTRAQGGIGLGLTIAKQLCHLMHGNISVESERGKGSRFSFDVLLRASTRQGNSNPMQIKTPQEFYAQTTFGSENTAVAKEPGEYRILIVEDDPISYRLAQDLLREIDVKSDIVTDGHDAIEKLSRTEHVHLYDIILMDCELPNLSGYDTTLRIRAGICGPGYKHIPIIAITSNALTGDREKCIDAGMSDYLAKPIEPETFLDLIRQWLSIAKQQAQIDFLTQQTADNSNITDITRKRDAI